MIELCWCATRIPGETLENDGVCLDGEAEVGRVLLIPHGPQNGMWTWSMTAVAPRVDRTAFQCSGILPTKLEAKAAVEGAYAEFVAADPETRAYWQKSCADLKARMERFQALRGGT